MVRSFTRSSQAKRTSYLQPRQFRFLFLLISLTPRSLRRDDLIAQPTQPATWLRTLPLPCSAFQNGIQDANIQISRRSYSKTYKVPRRRKFEIPATTQGCKLLTIVSHSIRVGSSVSIFRPLSGSLSLLMSCENVLTCYSSAV